MSKEIVSYYDRICTKRFDPAFYGLEGVTPETPAKIESILTLNQDVEPFIIQASAPQTLLHSPSNKILQFIHFSDIHAVQELWDRIVGYTNHYRDHIAFALHTGDYCCSHQDQYRDLYLGEACVRPILNCVGNHDTISPEGQMRSKESVHSKLFNHTENWCVTFMDAPYATAYYRDFPDSMVRLIVLDLYYDIQSQRAWLEGLLSDALEKGYHVITAMHEPSGTILHPENVTFHTLTAFSDKAAPVFDDILGNFCRSGGNFICNLSGHFHHDLFGFTENGVLNCSVECATDWAGWCDGHRIRGTRTYDCFNAVSIDTTDGLLKLVRIGDNTDRFLRIKRTLCYDYRSRQVIYNG